MFEKVFKTETINDSLTDLPNTRDASASKNPQPAELDCVEFVRRRRDGMKTRAGRN